MLLSQEENSYILKRPRSVYQNLKIVNEDNPNLNTHSENLLMKVKKINGDIKSQFLIKEEKEKKKKKIIKVRRTLFNIGKHIKEMNYLNDLVKKGRKSLLDNESPVKASLITVRKSMADITKYTTLLSSPKLYEQNFRSSLKINRNTKTVLGCDEPKRDFVFMTSIQTTDQTNNQGNKHVAFKDTLADIIKSPTKEATTTACNNSNMMTENKRIHQELNNSNNTHKQSKKLDSSKTQYKVGTVPACCLFKKRNFSASKFKIDLSKATNPCTKRSSAHLTKTPTAEELLDLNSLKKQNPFTLGKRNSQPNLNIPISKTKWENLYLKCEKQEENATKLEDRMSEYKAKSGINYRALKIVSEILSNFTISHQPESIKILNQIKSEKLSSRSQEDKHRIMFEFEKTKNFSDTFSYKYREMLVEYFKFDYSEDKDIIIKFKPKEEFIKILKADINHEHILKLLYSSLLTAGRINDMFALYFKNERKVQLFKKKFLETYKRKFANNEKFTLQDVKNEVMNKHMEDISAKIDLEVLEMRMKQGKGKLKLSELREENIESEWKD